MTISKINKSKRLVCELEDELRKYYDKHPDIDGVSITEKLRLVADVFHMMLPLVNAYRDYVKVLEEHIQKSRK